MIDWQGIVQSRTPVLKTVMRGTVTYLSLS